MFVYFPTFLKKFKYQSPLYFNGNNCNISLFIFDFLYAATLYLVGFSKVMTILFLFIKEACFY